MQIGNSEDFIQITMQALFDELRQALGVLDGPRCRNAVNLINEIDPEMGQHLQNKLEKLQYHEMLVALDSLK